MKIIFRYFAILMLCVVCNSAVAQSYSVPKAEVDLTTKSADELWNMGNTAYANGNYIDAERCYSEIMKRGMYSSDLYYNLGNVHHKRGELGTSLLYYYKALRLSPSDDDILHNIEVVSAKTEDNIERVPSFFIAEWSRAIGNLFSCMEWSVLSLIFLALLLAGIITYLLAENLKVRRIGFWGLVIFLFFFVTSTHHALEAREELVNPSEAIIMSKALSVKSSPSDGSTELFILHEGTKVSVITRLDGWCEVMIEDGKKGWVECRRIQTI